MNRYDVRITPGESLVFGKSLRKPGSRDEIESLRDNGGKNVLFDLGIWFGLSGRRVREIQGSGHWPLDESWYVKEYG